MNGKAIIAIAVTIILLIGIAMWGLPKYKVYRLRLSGVAALAEAENSRKVGIEEARAKKDSARLLAEAEIERAKGAAEANRIIGESLKGNEAYLRYLWIQGIGERQGENTVVYVPTEGNLPILEANRLKGK